MADVEIRFTGDAGDAEAAALDIDKALEQIEAIAKQVSSALGGIEIKSSSVSAIQSSSSIIGRALEGIRDIAAEAAAAVQSIEMSAGQAADVAADAAVMSAALDGVADSARRAKDEIRDVTGPTGRTMVGSFAAGVPFSDQPRFAAGQGGAPGNSLVPYSVVNMLLRDRVFAQSGQYAQTAPPAYRDIGRTLGIGDPATMSPGELAAISYLSSRRGGSGGGGTDIAALLGFGAAAGGGIPIPGFGRFGGFRFGGGMAGLGTLGGLAGFGAERMLASTLGIAGSMGGGILGGGLYGLGLLGTGAVGMGTDMAGIGQAAGDTKAVSQSLTNLNTQVALYGANSRQAALAQAQLNQTLAGFSPVARTAVLAAAQQSQAFKAMFDQVTGGAEKIGAEILNQGMGTGEKFLPTIGKFAQQNMGIIQQGIQPLMSWMQGTGGTQGLGIFTDLEKLFQQRLPTAVHAGSQAFEVFANIVDDSAHQVGGFLSKIDAFLTKVNTPSGLKSLDGEVTKLIGLFKTWVGLFGSIGGLLFDLFKPAVGLGADFAAQLTKVVNLVRQWLNASGTQNVLHSLFAAHLGQLNAIFDALRALMPFLESTLSAFLQIEAFVSSSLIPVFHLLATIISDITQYPLADKIMGWVAAFFIAEKAIKSVMTMTGLLKVALLGLGPAAATGAGEADASVASIGETAAASTAEVDTLRASLLSLGGAASILAGLGGGYLVGKGLKSLTGGGGAKVQQPWQVLQSAGINANWGSMSEAERNQLAETILKGPGAGGVYGSKNYLGGATSAQLQAWHDASQHLGLGAPGALAQMATDWPNMLTQLQRDQATGTRGQQKGDLLSMRQTLETYLADEKKGIAGGVKDSAVYSELSNIRYALQALATGKPFDPAKYLKTHPGPKIPPLSSFGGGGGGGVPALVPGDTALANAQQAYLAATGPGSTRAQQITAAKEYLAELKKIQATDEALHESGKKKLAVERELVTIAREINVAKREIAGPQASTASINSQTRNAQALIAQIRTLMGPAAKLAGGVQRTDPSELLQLPTVAEVQQKLAPVVARWKTQIAQFEKELKDHLISADAVTTIENRIDRIKTKVASALASMKQTAQQQASAFQSIWQTYVQSFNDTFDKTTQDVLAHPENYPAILPLSAALADLQNQHTQAQLQQALADAQNQLAEALSGANNSSSVLANAQKVLAQDALARALDVAQSKLLGGKPADMTDKILRDMRNVLTSGAPDPNAVKAAQRAVAEAEYEIKVNSLSKQADAEQTAYSASRAALKQHLDQSLAMWGDFYANSGMSADQALTMLNKLLMSFGFQPIANPWGDNPFAPPTTDPATTTATPRRSGTGWIPLPGSVTNGLLADGGIVTKPHYLVGLDGRINGMIGEGGHEIVVPASRMSSAPYSTSTAPSPAHETHVHVTFANGMEWLSEFVDVRVMKNAPAISKKIGRDADHRRRGGRF